MIFTTPSYFHGTNPGICVKKINAYLPEFYSRKYQEEFIKIIKGLLNLYPIEAIFIGLSGIKPREKQVSLKFLLLMYSNMPRVRAEKETSKYHFSHLCVHCTNTDALELVH